MAAIDEVRGYLRIDAHDEDALIETLIAAAIGVGEGFLGSVLLRRSVSETVAAGPAWVRLRATPVVAITAVEGPDGALPVAAYAIDIDAAGDGWVRLAQGSARVRVTLTAGIAEEWAGLPAAVALGVVRLAAHLFAHRDDGGDDGERALPAAVAALWRPWRRMRLGIGRAA